MGDEPSSPLALPDPGASHHLLAAAFDDTPLGDPRKLGDFMWAHFDSQESPDASILDESIQATQIAVDLEQGSARDRAQLLSNLGHRLMTRYGLKYALNDLDEAIAAFQRAVELTSDNNPNQVAQLDRLGFALLEKFTCIGALDELNAAMTAFCCAVELAPDAHADNVWLLTNYGISFKSRFERLGELEDIECAIGILRRAHELVPDGHPDKPSCSSNLGNSFHARFERTGELEDLEQAISTHRRAVELSLDSHPDKPSMLNNFASSLFARFKQTGDVENLEQAISTHRHAIELTPDGHPSNPLRFTNLGILLLTRFKHTGDLENLEQAISTHRRAIELTPDGHPDKPSKLDDFGISLLSRFEHTGQLMDIEQAISMHRHAVELTPDGHRSKQSRFHSLGNSFLAQFDCTGDLEDLEQAIATYRSAVELTSDGNLDQHLLFNGLGTSFLTRFECTGELEDLEQAISILRRAVELMPDGHPDKPSLFNNLGNSFLRRFQRIGGLEDLEQAISIHRRAVELTLDGHPYKLHRFNNLGLSLSTRFKRTGKFEDLEQAISSYRRGLELTPDDHSQKPTMLRHLGSNLCSRYRRTRELADIQEAVSAGERAIELTPEGHPTLSGHYGALGGCFESCFVHSGDISDIKKSISLSQKAVQLLPDGDPRLSLWLCNLGQVQELLFRFTQAQADFDTAVESFTRATLHISGRPSIRFDSAMRCARMLSDYRPFNTTDSMLSAHSRIIAILPEIVWLGHDIHRRYEESSQLGELVNAAVAAAVAAGKLEQAVEWLEAGRALIWAQVLALRTPLDELQDSHPDLAKSLRSVQQQLQSSAHSAFAQDVDAFGGVDGLTVNRAADRHRGLVIEYDRLMKDVRACPGFEDFLRPKRLCSLLPPPGLMSGHIVFINVHSSRCDAIGISPSGEMVAIPLPDLSLERAAELQRLWTDHVMGDRARTQRSLGSVGDFEGELNPLKYYLRHTWTWIVQPVLEALDLAASIQNDRLPHIIWCPTGPLMQLPLHAAGIYDEPHGPRAYDFVVSSYTPSLSALARSFQGGSVPHMARDMLIVTQPSTPGHMPLPGTVHEGIRLRDTLTASQITSNWLNDEKATVHEVRAVMKEYPWVHLACHGSQNRVDVTQSAFHLFDGPLTLADLMGTAADNAELAFLSACQTAAGDKHVPEESAHLAAGMLAVGFKGVVATMWSIQDADAPIVVEAYYKELLALRGSGTLGKGETGAAYALHEATRVLRELVGEKSFMRWVPFVHFGV